MKLQVFLFIVLGSLLLLFIGSSCPDDSDADQGEVSPRCDNCHAVVDVLSECLHYVGDANGTPCSTTQCIENTLNTHSCDRHDDRTGDPDCDTKTEVPNRAEVVQRVWPKEGCGGTVRWTVYKNLYYGCGDDCERKQYRKACETENCTGSGRPILGPFNRGQRKVCNC